MKPPRLIAIALLTTPLVLAQASAACSSNNATSGSSAATSSTSSGAGGAGGGGGAGGAAPMPSAICQALNLDARPFSQGPYGVRRGEIAADFTLPLADGSSWTFKDRFSGCETYVFVPDTLAVSDLDAASLWTKDIDHLVQKSPKNVHYFFVSRKPVVDDANAATQAMQQRVTDLLATLSPEDAEHWKAHLHVVLGRAADYGNWIGDELASRGRIGFAIDRRQVVRGVGHFADVTRYDSKLNAAMKWPWRSNLAYAANEALYLNAQSDQQDQLDAQKATVVDLFKGEILEEFQETDVMLPSAQEMAAFDTLEVEVTQACPDPDQIELGNCGAWDYLAWLSVRDAQMNNIEIARFITSYHREAHWVVDVSQMLVHIKAGGMTHFRWDFAPSWNTQPTATKLSLRLSNKSKGMRPSEATSLWSGGAFTKDYNMNHAPIDVPIPADAKKVELFGILTGHGADAKQCAEFCNHQHQLEVNGMMHLIQFPMAGTQDKCMPELAHGMVPNQAGTWWFGRGGWCPGKQVDPVVLDITKEVTPGQTAHFTYMGLYGGQPPTIDPMAMPVPGNINLTSYVVVWR